MQCWKRLCFEWYTSQEDLLSIFQFHMHPFNVLHRMVSQPTHPYHRHPPKLIFHICGFLVEVFRWQRQDMRWDTSNALIFTVFEFYSRRVISKYLREIPAQVISKYQIFFNSDCHLRFLRKFALFHGKFVMKTYIKPKWQNIIKA